MNEDPLGPARGCFVSVLLSLILLLFVVLVWELLRH